MFRNNLLCILRCQFYFCKVVNQYIDTDMLVEINCRINPWNQLSDLAYLLQLIRINGLIHFVRKQLPPSNSTQKKLFWPHDRVYGLPPWHKIEFREEYQYWNNYLSIAMIWIDTISTFLDRSPNFQLLEVPLP